MAYLFPLIPIMYKGDRKICQEKKSSFLMKNQPVVTT